MEEDRLSKDGVGAESHRFRVKQDMGGEGKDGLRPGWQVSSWPEAGRTEARWPRKAAREPRVPSP